MNTKKIIEEIECRYKIYSVSESDTMLYYWTKEFYNYLKSYEVIEDEIKRIKQKYPFDENDFLAEKGNDQLPGGLLQSVFVNEERYVSFVLHFLDWKFTKNDYYSEMYDDAYWTCSNNNDYQKHDRIRLFKQNVIYPITTYIIGKLKNGLNICSILEQFKARAVRFHCLSKIKSEKEVQDKIALYLFDSGNECHREEDSGHGIPDFLFSDDDGLFVVEVKFVKKEKPKGQQDLERWTTQLKSYMSQYPCYHGILFIVTQANYEYRWKGESNDMTIMTVYVGNLQPSERGKIKIIEIDI